VGFEVGGTTWYSLAEAVYIIKDGELQVGGAGLGFGAPGAGSTAPAMPTSAAGIARAPAAQKTAAAMEAGFAKGGLESTIEGTLQPSVPAPAQAAAPASNGQAAPPVQQAFSPFTASIPCLV